MDYETASVIGTGITTAANVFSYLVAKEALQHRENPRKIMNHFKDFADPDHFPAAACIFDGRRASCLFSRHPGKRAGDLPIPLA